MNIKSIKRTDLYRMTLSLYRSVFKRCIVFALKRQFRYPAAQSFVSCDSKWFQIYSLMKRWSVILVF